MNYALELVSYKWNVKLSIYFKQSQKLITHNYFCGFRGKLARDFYRGLSHQWTN